jgi:hypothetical protein
MECAAAQPHLPHVNNKASLSTYSQRTKIMSTFSKLIFGAAIAAVSIASPAFQFLFITENISEFIIMLVLQATILRHLAPGVGLVILQGGRIIMTQDGVVGHDR